MIGKGLRTPPPTEDIPFTKPFAGSWEQVMRPSRRKQCRDRVRASAAAKQSIRTGNTIRIGIEASKLPPNTTMLESFVLPPLLTDAGKAMAEALIAAGVAVAGWMT